MLKIEKPLPRKESVELILHRSNDFLDFQVPKDDLPLASLIDAIGAPAA
jgi:hypothetical protein